MGANKIGSYIVHYRSRRKEAHEEERRRKAEDVQKRPEIVDPSFELFGYTSPLAESSFDEPRNHETSTISQASTRDDWHFQSRKSGTLPRNYQFEPYCEVTPKSSVSSTNSAASDAPSSTQYDMGWDTASTARPRPQSYLPSTASASYSFSMTDLHRGTEYKSRRQSTYQSPHQRQDSLPSYDRSQNSQPIYKVGATLTRPFSVDDPLDFTSEAASSGSPYSSNSDNSQRRRSADEPLSAIPENQATGVNVAEHLDDLIKRGYRA